MPVWAMLPNIPLPFWHHKFLEEIGNNLGKYKKIDLERLEKDLFSFARICVEIDLNKSLPDHIEMKHKFFQWKQVLNYENMTFRCQTCFQIGHL